MLPTTALVMFETYFGHRLLSVRRRTLQCQRGRGERYKVQKFFALSAREIILYPFKNYGAAPEKTASIQRVYGLWTDWMRLVTRVVCYEIYRTDLLMRSAKGTS
jgi:hypothetical protein